MTLVVAAAVSALVVGVAPAANAAPTTSATPSAASPLVRICSWRVNASNVRFRIHLHSTAAYGLLQRGNVVAGVPTQTGTDGGLVFQKAHSDRFGHTGWVVRKFLTTIGCVTAN